MSTLFPKIIEFERQTNGAYVGGKWVADPEVTNTFLGSVQPLTGKQMEAFPTNRQDLGLVNVFSSSKLEISTEGGGNAGDVVLWEGRKWELFKEEIHANSLIPHFKYIGQYKELI